jgi:hypothetical protein
MATHPAGANMKRYTLFYAGRIHIETDDARQMKIDVVGPEIYNGGYIYTTQDEPPCWYNCDFTPCLIEDVPKELRALLLILT